MSINKLRITAAQAGYLELPGAVKDGDCEIVEVEDGISKDRGCCNSYGWRSRNPKSFSCGECKYLADSEEYSEQEDGKRPISRREASEMTDEELLSSDRPVVIGKAKRE